MKTTATGATVNFNQGLQDKRYTLFRFRTKMIIENIVRTVLTISVTDQTMLAMFDEAHLKN